MPGEAPQDRPPSVGLALGLEQGVRPEATVPPSLVQLCALRRPP